MFRAIVVLRTRGLKQFVHFVAGRIVLRCTSDPVSIRKLFGHYACVIPALRPAHCDHNELLYLATLVSPQIKSDVLRRIRIQAVVRLTTANFLCLLFCVYFFYN